MKLKKYKGYSEMQVLGLRHMGILVSNFDSIIKFYFGLGFKLLVEDCERGEFIERLLNGKNLTF